MELKPTDEGYEVYRQHFLDVLRHTSVDMMGFGYKELRVCESSGKRYMKIEIIVEDIDGTEGLAEQHQHEQGESD